MGKPVLAEYVLRLAFVVWGTNLNSNPTLIAIICASPKKFLVAFWLVDLCGRAQIGRQQVCQQSFLPVSSSGSRGRASSEGSSIIQVGLPAAAASVELVLLSFKGF